MDINGQSIDQYADPSITGSVNRQAGMTNEGLAEKYDSGNSEGRGLLSQGSGFNSGLSYGDKAQSDAIKARYMPKYNLQENELKLENVKSAQTDHIRNLSVATQAASQEVEMNKQKAILKWKIDQQNKQARGAALGQILGITGGVVGGIYGGAGGATAGYAAGSGVGNAVGSANG